MMVQLFLRRTAVNSSPVSRGWAHSPDPKRLAGLHAAPQQRHALLARFRAVARLATLPIDSRSRGAFEGDLWCADGVGTMVVLALYKVPPTTDGLVFHRAQLLHVACTFLWAMHAHHAVIRLCIVYSGAKRVRWGHGMDRDRRVTFQ